MPVLPEIAAIKAGLARSQVALPLQSGSGSMIPVDLGQHALVDISRFVRFEIQHSNGQTDRFVTLVEESGLPEDSRLDAIFAEVVQNPAAFISFVRMMLGADTDGAAFGAAFGGRTGAFGPVCGSADDEPLLETLVRAFSRSSPELIEIDDMVRRLQGTQGANLLPQEFQDLWQVFRAALPKRKAPRNG